MENKGNEIEKHNEIWGKTAMVLLGSFIYALAINAFITPHKLLSAGVAGISLICQYITNIPSGYWVLIINIPIFIIAYKKLDKEFTILSIVGMLSMSGFLVATKNIAQFIKVEDIMIGTIFGAVISGIGIGLIFKEGASQGGIDIIAILLRRKNGKKISTLYFMLNIIIVIMGIFVTSFQLALYTIISMYIKSIVLEKTINLFNEKRIVMIVTEKEEEISNVILNELGRGVTFLYGEGAYTKVKRKILYCILKEGEVSKAKKLVEAIDDNALISVLEACDVQGNGFLKAAI